MADVAQGPTPVRKLALELAVQYASSRSFRENVNLTAVADQGTEQGIRICTLARELERFLNGDDPTTPAWATPDDPRSRTRML